jgi:uncharacterized protein YjbI with pentapeptide repeats
VAPRRARRAPRASATRDLHIDGAVADTTEWRDACVTSDDVIGSTSELWISGCTVRDVRFTGAELRELRVDNTVFERCDFSGVIAESIDLVQCELRECRMDALVANDGRWHDVLVEQCTMRDASLRFTGWQHAAFVDVVLAGADLTNATFEQTTFERCDCTGAQFWHASLAGTGFPGCRLEGVRGGAAFAGTRLEVAQILDVAPTVFEGLGIEIVDG